MVLRRLVMLTLLLVAIGLICDRVLMPVRRPGDSAHLILCSFLTAVYGGALLYSWNRFRYGRELRWLLNCSSAFILTAANILGILVLSGVSLLSGFGLEGRFYTYCLVLVGLPLILAPRATRRVDGIKGRRLIECFFISGVVIVVVNHLAGDKIAWGIYFLNSISTGRSELLPILDICSVITIAAVYGMATVVNTRKCCRTGEHLSMLVSYWCIITAVYAVFTSIARYSGSHASWASVVLSGLAGLAVLVELNAENGRLHVEAKEKMAELEVLHVVSWDLVGMGTMEGLAEALSRAFTEHLHANAAAVFLSEPEQDALRLMALSGEQFKGRPVGDVYSLAPDRRPGFHNGHTARAFKEGGVTVVDGIFADVEFIPWQVLAKQDGTVVSVPIGDCEGIMGVFDLLLASREQIPEERICLYQTIAAAAGAAIRHIQIKQDREFLRDLDAAA